MCCQSTVSCRNALSEDFEKQNGHEQLHANRTGKTLQDKQRQSCQSVAASRPPDSRLAAIEALALDRLPLKGAAGWVLIERIPPQTSIEPLCRTRQPPTEVVRYAAELNQTGSSRLAGFPLRQPHRNECETSASHRGFASTRRTAAESETTLPLR